MGTMIGKLVFKLPEETSEFKTAQQASAYLAALQELDNHLRGLIKYTDTETINVQEMRDKLHEICNDMDIDIWE